MHRTALLCCTWAYLASVASAVSNASSSASTFSVVLSPPAGTSADAILTDITFRAYERWDGTAEGWTVTDAPPRAGAVGGALVDMTQSLGYDGSGQGSVQLGIDQFAHYFGPQGACSTTGAVCKGHDGCTDGGECVGLGDLDTQAVALMPKQRGLVVTYTGGEYCVGGANADRPRHRVTYYVYCNQAVQPVKLLQMDTSRPCETRLWFQSAAGCAIATAKCAPTCPKHWLGDGTCDQGCNNEACGHDGGDCWGAKADDAQCSPGCKEGWLGDGICDEECRSHACQDDRGDCAGQCAPGCEKAWLGDGKCDEECNTPSCNFDGADCFDFSTYTSRATTRCAWGCPANWRANGVCDPGCDVAACGWDGDDCLEGSITKILKGSRRTAGPLGPTILFALVALTLYLTYQWRDDLMSKGYKSV